ncbi:MAG: hypothetical protein ACREK1_02370 [Longimicrobiales bacterium]
MGGDRVLPELTGLDEESDRGRRILERRGEIFRTRYLPGPGSVSWSSGATGTAALRWQNARRRDVGE